MAKDDGGPAFPSEQTGLVRFVADGVFESDDPRNFVEGTRVSPGMSLRDFFAAHALTFLQSRENVTAILDSSQRHERNEEPEAAFARVAYQVADAMLKERVKP